MTRLSLTLATLVFLMPLSATADEALRFCGTDVLYDVSMSGDKAIIVRAAEVRVRCTIEQDVMTCDDGAEIPFEIDGDELILNPDKDMPVVMPLCDQQE